MKSIGKEFFFGPLLL